MGIAYRKLGCFTALDTKQIIIFLDNLIITFYDYNAEYKLTI